MVPALPFRTLTFIAVTAVAQNPQFEAASVKVNRSGPTAAQRVVIQPGERVILQNVTAQTIISVAYDINAERIANKPGWLNADRFDVTAKAERFSTVDELTGMLRHLLTARFRLVAHKDMRSSPTFDLVLARSDGRLGPGLRKAERDCDMRADATDRNPDPCGMQSLTRATLFGKISVKGLRLNSVLGQFVRDAGRPIVNKTGIDGPVDVDFAWTPRSYNLDVPRGIDPDGPRLETALQEQLGLKLEPATDSREFLVIDRLEHPTEN